ncbi:DUF4352 domain-containing protein, partial [Paractinoplanes ferrugineus]
GKQEQGFDGSLQKLLDAKGTEYSNDEAAAAGVSETNTLFLDINPGNSVKVTLVYDVPKGTKPTAIKLNDSMFSGSVKVALT